MKNGTLTLLACLLLVGCQPQGTASNTEPKPEPKQVVPKQEPNQPEADVTKHHGWYLDFEAAKKEAAKLNRPILADFSGSDWCGWCIKLDKEVFSQEAFKTYADANVVRFLADFPRRTPQTDEIKKQNKALAEKYGVRGFPTVLILDAAGEVKHKTGYQPGGAENYVAHLKSLLKKQ